MARLLQDLAAKPVLLAQTSCSMLACDVHVVLAFGCRATWFTIFPRLVAACRGLGAVMCFTLAAEPHMHACWHCQLDM